MKPAIWLFIPLILVGIGGFLFVSLGRGATDFLLNRAIDRQLFVTKATGASIGTFVDMASKSLAVLGTNLNITEETLEKFVDQWRGTPVRGVAISDETGKIRYQASNGESSTIGLSIADREYFSWAKSATVSGSHISNLIISRTGPSKGKYIVPMAASIRDKNKFIGVVFTSIPMEPLAHDYLNSLSAIGDNKIYLSTADGTILISPDGDLVGKNIFEEIKTSGFLGNEVISQRIRGFLQSSESGYLDAVWPTDTHNINSMKRQLLTYTPIKIDGITWYLGIAIPVDTLFKQETPIYFAGLLFLVILFLIVVIYTVYFMHYLHHKDDNGTPTIKQ